MNRSSMTGQRRVSADNTLRNSVVVAMSTATVVTMFAIIGWNVFEFDRALFVYAQTLIISVTLTAYRLTIWVHRPPTLVVYQRAIAMLQNTESILGLGKHISRSASAPLFCA